MRKASGRGSGANKKAGRLGLVVVCVGSGQEFEASLEMGSWVGGRTTAAGGQRHRVRGIGNGRIMRRLRRERVENGVGSGHQRAPIENKRTILLRKGKDRVLIIWESGAKMPADLGGDIYLELEDKTNIKPIENGIASFTRAL
jgi:hypothetical protein